MDITNIAFALFLAIGAHGETDTRFVGINVLNPNRTLEECAAFQQSNPDYAAGAEHFLGRVRGFVCRPIKHGPGEPATEMGS